MKILNLKCVCKMDETFNCILKLIPFNMKALSSNYNFHNTTKRTATANNDNRRHSNRLKAKRQKLKCAFNLSKKAKQEKKKKKY